MAVTVTYAWSFVQNLDLIAGPIQDYADVVGLADGGFAAVGNHAGHTDLDVFSSNLAHTSQTLNIAGSFGSVAQLTNGNIVSTSSNGTNAFYTITTQSGFFLSSVVVAGGNSKTGSHVAALANGNFVVVTSEIVAPSLLANRMAFYLYEAAGDPLPGGAIISSGIAVNASAAVAALDDGGFAVAWYEASGNLFTAVYNANGSVRRGALAFDSRDLGATPFDMTATDEGFAIVYETDTVSANEDIALARFAANGALIEQGTLTGALTEDASPQIARMPNGLLAVTFTYNFNGSSNADTDLILYDPATGTIVAERNIVAGEPIGDSAGRPTVAHHGNGRVVVFHTNTTDADVDGEAVTAVRTSTGDGANDSFTGSSYTDVFNGGGGSDDLSYAGATGGVTVNLALAGPQNVGGGQGTDTLSSIEVLRGSSFADQLTGNSSANRFDGGGGNDTMAGGLGNDTYVVPQAGDIIVEAAGGGTDEVLAFTSFSLAAIANVENLLFVNLLGLTNFSGTGNSLGNRITGAATIDSLSGLAGRDTIYGGLGFDTIHGGDETGAGDVLLGGEAGADVIYGGQGNDRIDGGADGDTYLDGGAGLDYVTGGAGNDRIEGGTENDAWLGGDGGSDSVAGGLGNDRIDGGTENDVLLGEAGNDTITCGDGDDGAQGGDGDDYIQGQAGYDRIYGGIGNDVVTGGDEEPGPEGPGDLWLGGDAGADRIYGGASSDRIDGGADSDIVLSGDAGDDFINCGDGDDRGYGGADADRLNGQAGRDQLYGGSGGDDLYGGDEVGAGDTRLGGDAGADYIYGGGGNDRLEGGTENDRLLGGLGLDTSNGGAGADQFFYNSIAEGGAGEQIGDWQGGIDTLLIDASGFGGGLTAGPLAANRLVLGTAATQAFGQFLFNSANGVLYWDSNGNGAGALQFLVKLYTPTFGAPPASLATTDFEIVA